MQSVYIETTIASYLTARPSRDLIQAARQQLTTEWWDTIGSNCDLFVSKFVLDEAAEGHPEAAERRLDAIKDVPILQASESSESLTLGLIENGLIPAVAAQDAAHVAIASVGEIEVLLTWNCTHLANASILRKMERYIRSCGYEPPVICTPEEMLG